MWIWPLSHSCAGKCMLGWKTCTNHYNWELQKSVEFQRETYQLTQHLENLKERENGSTQRMQRRLDQFVSGETRGHRSTVS